jgi:hypothetical protein
MKIDGVLASKWLTSLKNKKAPSIKTHILKWAEIRKGS